MSDLFLSLISSRPVLCLSLCDFGLAERERETVKEWRRREAWNVEGHSEAAEMGGELRGIERKGRENLVRM